MKLNAEQKKAVEQIHGPFLCIAGPGSGKTTVIINRVHYMVTHGVDPERILVMTFGKAAAEEMETRYQALKGAKSGVSFSTIHAFANKVVFRERKYHGYSVMEEKVQRRFMLEMIREGVLPDDIGDTNEITRYAMTDISKYRELEPEEREEFSGSLFLRHSGFMRLYNAYQDFKKSNKLIDFDDMLYKARAIFGSRPDILEEFRNRYQYLCIDEFQDTSRVQAELIYALAYPKNNLFICGDDDQSIYGFRNAKPQIMLAFQKKFPDCGVANLNINYRCDQKIVSTSKELIRHNKVRFEKQISGNSENEGNVELFDDLAEAVLEENANGTPFYEMAVLSRTNRELAGPASILMNHNIPFYCTAPIEDIHSGFLFNAMYRYLKIAYGDDSWENISGIINSPGRKIKKDYIAAAASLPGLLDLAGKRQDRFAIRQIKELSNDIRRIRKLAETKGSVAETADAIWEYLEFDRFVTDRCAFLVENKTDVLQGYDFIREEMKEAKSFTEFDSMVRQRQILFEQCMKRNASNKGRGVTLTTMHSAKGKEWDSVFVIGCSKENIPKLKRNQDYSQKEYQEQVEEERRLLYVALTRPKRHLFISPGKGEPSRFLYDSGLLTEGSRSGKQKCPREEPA